MQRYCTPAYARRQTRKHGVPFRLARASCKLTDCNPSCAGTSFGSKLRLSAKLRKLPMYVRGEAWRRRFEAKRRRSFGTRKNILNNGFYEKLPAKLVQERRKQGAISGCYEK